MKASLFYLPSIASRAEIEQGMAGMNPDFYQRMLKELTEQIKLGDALGYDSVSFTEHHFHIEGFELSNNPVLLDLYFAMQTKRIRVGQLGIVLPASNPIRVAEDIAMLDHMTGGRANAGFARGYQRRWVDIMAQHEHGVHGAASSPVVVACETFTVPAVPTDAVDVQQIVGEQVGHLDRLTEVPRVLDGLRRRCGHRLAFVRWNVCQPRCPWLRSSALACSSVLAATFAMPCLTMSAISKRFTARRGSMVDTSSASRSTRACLAHW